MHGKPGWASLETSGVFSQTKEGAMEEGATNAVALIQLIGPPR
jgi:hypothetical protein